ncbi:hypothetical protein [Dokdonia sp. Hel_I_53]|uniref:DUF922 domain-containing protein n=1 Tax=Dokdonia sp. Hel_I_53 TaxID=1566287 RepID=UPI00119BA6B5|nr:hypothetical protein [Dokdonia sp. Hel_I_53]TVZ52071.1 hypothetical protein OD90_1234 [Dokdonia sp. Hel_I_53]
MRFLLLILSLCALGSFVNISERIEWDIKRQLEWSDFKGTPVFLENWAASSSTGMSQSYQINNKGFLDKNDVRIKAHFYPEYSWIKEGRESQYLLAHEQTHFDITEVYARKLSELIEKTTFSKNSLQEVKALYNQVEKERVAAQEQFDLETKHSLEREEELKWRAKVKGWLMMTKGG